MSQYRERACNIYMGYFRVILTDGCSLIKRREKFVTVQRVLVTIFHASGLVFDGLAGVKSLSTHESSVSVEFQEFKLNLDLKIL